MATHVNTVGVKITERSIICNLITLLITVVSQVKVFFVCQ